MVAANYMHLNSKNRQITTTIDVISGNLLLVEKYGRKRHV
jgi:hypothetical protein